MIAPRPSEIILNQTISLPQTGTEMNAQLRRSDLLARTPLPSLRFDIAEAAQILRMSRAQLYNRIHEGSITPQKDGTRTYITYAELERYVASCGARYSSD
jgi:excisionase family DNA binding protein